MYIVRNSNKEIIAICSRKEDALAFKHASKVDKDVYTITVGENKCVK